MSATDTHRHNRFYSTFEAFTGDRNISKNEMYLSFRLVDNDYGIEVGYVVEAIGVRKITELPETPAFIKGVIDYRGTMIFAVDLRIYLDLPPRDDGALYYIIVIDYQNDRIGLIVDKVNEVRKAVDNELIPVCSRYGKGRSA